MTERTSIARTGIRRFPLRRSPSGARRVCKLQGAILGICLAMACLSGKGRAESIPWPPPASQDSPAPCVDAAAAPPPVRWLAPRSDEFSAWWDDALHRPLQPNSEARYLTIESLIVAALQTSSRVSVIKDLPLIRRTSIPEAEASFDWKAFIDTKWFDIDDPVGDFAIGGGQTRLLNEGVDYRMGLRRQNIHGGRFEVAQEFAWENSNSNFFLPKNQGFGQLTLGYTQPILRGAGVEVNSGPIVLAQLDTQIARDELFNRLQLYLVELARAYWRLYLERGYVLQQRQALAWNSNVLEQLEARVDVDAATSQIARARAAVAARQAELIRAEANAGDAQSRIRQLVSDAGLGGPCPLELLPMNAPAAELIRIDFPLAVQTALRLRPEMDQAIQQIRATATRLEISKNDLLPVLDLILQTYVQGLEGNSDVPRAFADQFSTSEPSYEVGLRFEVPIYYRAARARVERQRLELRQVTSQMNVTTETVVGEVDRANRAVGASFAEMKANFEAMQASDTERKFIQRRWEQLTSDDRLGSVVLQDLLDAQDRLTLAEFRFLRSQVNYTLALVDLQKATGMLLHDERISFNEARLCGLPEIILDKPVLRGR